MEKVSVIIVSWNVADSLARCLTSVRSTRYPSLEIIVVDNASSDGSQKFATIKNDQNIGFPRAVNQGLSQATGDYILILNPDTRIPKDFFTESIKFMQSHSDAGLMGPKFLNQGSVYNEPSVFNAIKEYWLGQKNSFEKYTPQSESPMAVDAVTGACMFLTRKTLEKVGSLTESVFMYYEDLDYCRRVRSAGLKVYFNPQIVIEHEHGSSSKQNPQVNKYLIAASKWYNGIIKYYLLYFIIRSSQVFAKLVGEQKTRA